MLLGQARVVTCHDVMAIQSMQGLISHIRLSHWQDFAEINFIGLNSTPNIVCVSNHTEELRRTITNHKVKTSTVLQPLNYDFYMMTRASALETLKT